MLLAKTTNDVFILGLDAENINRLKDGKPILISLAKAGGHDDIMIMYGDTVDAIKAELEFASGHDMPEPKPLPTQN